MKPGSCPVCQGTFNTFITNIRDWEYGVPFESDLVTCSKCGLVTHTPAVAAETIPSLYPSTYLAYVPASRKQSIYGTLKAVLRRHTAKKCLQQIPAYGTFLEIGCGDCALIETMAAIRSDVQFFGIDIKDVSKPDIVNFRFLQGQLEEVTISHDSIDLIYCSNLIEHVADPVGFLTVCNSLLKPGGRLLGVTPDHLSIDRYLFGRYWAGYHYPRHTFLFNHKNIRLLLDNTGYKDVMTKGSYSFWYLSLANRFMTLPGLKKRGLGFALVTLAMIPVDLLINLFSCHGSMSFRARKPGKKTAASTGHSS